MKNRDILPMLSDLMELVNNMCLNNERIDMYKIMHFIDTIMNTVRMQNVVDGISIQELEGIVKQLEEKYNQ